MRCLLWCSLMHFNTRHVSLWENYKSNDESLPCWWWWSGSCFFIDFFFYYYFPASVCKQIDADDALNYSIVREFGGYFLALPGTRFESRIRRIESRSRPYKNPTLNRPLGGIIREISFFLLYPNSSDRRRFVISKCGVTFIVHTRTEAGRRVNDFWRWFESIFLIRRQTRNLRTHLDTKSDTAQRFRALIINLKKCFLLMAGTYRLRSTYPVSEGMLF